jgi:hypothetical protein
MTYSRTFESQDPHLDKKEIKDSQSTEVGGVISTEAKLREEQRATQQACLAKTSEIIRPIVPLDTPENCLAQVRANKERQTSLVDKALELLKKANGTDQALERLEKERKEREAKAREQY